MPTGTPLTRHCTCRPVALLGMVLYTIWCIYAAGAALRFMVNMVYLELTCRTHRFASFVVSAIRNITFLTYLVHATHATAAWWWWWWGVVAHVCSVWGGLGWSRLYNGASFILLSSCGSAPVLSRSSRSLSPPLSASPPTGSFGGCACMHACMLSSVW